MTEKHRRRIFAALALILGLVAAFATCEVVLRSFNLRYSHTPWVSDPRLHHAHPKDSSFVSHQWAQEFGGHRIRYDQQGCIVNPTKKPSISTRRIRVAFLGDSFVEALQVPWQESFVGLLEASAHRDAEIKNFAVSSYSPILYRLQHQVDVARFDPTHVFVMLYDNDMSNDEQYAEIAIRNDAGEVVAVPGPSIGWLRKIFRPSYFVRFLRKHQLRIRWLIQHRGQKVDRGVGGYIEENPEITPMTEEFLLDLHRMVEEGGGQLILTVVPSKYAIRNKTYRNGDLEFSDKVKGWADSVGIPFLDLAGPFHAHAEQGEALFFDLDIHFNPRGHGIVADVLRTCFPELFSRQGLDCSEGRECGSARWPDSGGLEAPGIACPEIP